MLCGGLQGEPGPQIHTAGAEQCQLEPAGWPVPLCFWGSPPFLEGDVLTPPLPGKMVWGEGDRGEGVAGRVPGCQAQTVEKAITWEPQPSRLLK